MMLPNADLESILDSTKSLWTELRGKKFFISGGTGFVGSWLLESFLYANKKLSLGSEVWVLSRNPDLFLKKNPHCAEDLSCHWIQSDIRSFEFPTENLDYVIHAAMDPALASLEGSLETMDVSYLGTKRVLEMCRQTKVQKYLLLSSGAVYGRQSADVSHMDENFTGFIELEKSSSAYAESKRLAECLSHAYGQKFGFETKVARCFALIGPRIPLDGHFAVGNFIRQALAAEDIEIKGDGQALRSYLYASDMTIWLWNILFRGKNRGAYNVGSEKEFPLAEIAKKIISLEDQKIQLRILGQATTGISGDRYIPSTQKIQQELGLKMNIPIEMALQKTMSFYKGVQ